jgi:hypothetical protein
VTHRRIQKRLDGKRSSAQRSSDSRNSRLQATLRACSRPAEHSRHDPPHLARVGSFDPVPLQKNRPLQKHVKGRTSYLAKCMTGTKIAALAPLETQEHAQRVVHGVSPTVLQQRQRDVRVRLRIHLRRALLQSERHSVGQIKTNGTAQAG